jgi:hypothetical protein
MDSSPTSGLRVRLTTLRLKCVLLTTKLRGFIFIYLILTSFGLMPGGCVYKDHLVFNKKTAYTSHENSTKHRTNFHRTVQVHEHYKTQQKTKNTEENKMNILPGKEPGPSSL